MKGLAWAVGIGAALWFLLRGRLAAAEEELLVSEVEDGLPVEIPGATIGDVDTDGLADEEDEDLGGPVIFGDAPEPIEDPYDDWPDFFDPEDADLMAETGDPPPLGSGESLEEQQEELERLTGFEPTEGGELAEVLARSQARAEALRKKPKSGIDKALKNLEKLLTGKPGKVKVGGTRKAEKKAAKVQVKAEKKAQKKAQKVAKKAAKQAERDAKRAAKGKPPKVNRQALKAALRKPSLDPRDYLPF